MNGCNRCGGGAETWPCTCPASPHAADARPDPVLTPAEVESLALLAEECGEVVQRCTKVLRFGFTVNPWTGKHNRAQLEAELGDLIAQAVVADANGVASLARVLDAADRKLAALRVADGRVRRALVPGGTVREILDDHCCASDACPYCR